MSLLVEENGTELYRYVVSVGKLIWKLGTFATNLIFLHLFKGVFTNYRI